MRESARESKSWEGSGRGGPNGPLRRNSGASRGFNSGGLHPEDSTAISTIIEQMRSGGSAGRRLASAQVPTKGSGSARQATEAACVEQHVRALGLEERLTNTLSYPRRLREKCLLVFAPLKSLRSARCLAWQADGVVGAE